MKPKPACARVIYDFFSFLHELKGCNKHLQETETSCRGYHLIYLIIFMFFF